MKDVEVIKMTKYPVPYKKDSVYFQYSVKDFDRAKKFYEEVMGFEKIRREYVSQMLFPSEVIYGVKP